MDPVILPHSNNPRVTDAPRPFRHYIRVQTRFADFDMLGHMNNAAYLTLFDLAKTRYFEHLLQKPIDWKQPGMVVVNINCDYFQPTLFDQQIEIFTATIKVGTHSLTLEQRLVDTQTLQVHAICRTVMAAFDPATASTIEIPTPWRTALAALGDAS